MPEPFLSFAFSAGVLAPGLLSRPDLEKYDLALRKAHNWVVDYRGGIGVRPPTEFILPTRTNDRPIRLIPFRFNLFQGNVYILELGEQYIRFIRDGRYVTRTDNPIDIVSITNTTDAVVTTAAPHNLFTGAPVYLNTGIFELDRFPFAAVNITATTFQLNVPGPEDLLDLSYLPSVITSGTIAQVYERGSPYLEADLFNIDYEQYRDEIRFTHSNYFPRKLTRIADDNWTLEAIDFQGNRNAPGAPNIAIGTTNAQQAYNPDSGPGAAGVLYGITAVNADGQESYLKSIGMSLTALDITNFRGYTMLDWEAVPGAVSYNVYRSLYISYSHAITFAQELGYIGKTQAPIFQDMNIIPDFTKTPLIIDSPFVDGAVLSIDITASGTGYGKLNTTISITGGSDFEGLPIVNEDGEIIGCRILNPGHGYEGGVVSFGGDGSGATATITTSPTGGNNPTCLARAQQRQIYAGTVNLPMTVFASRTGEPDTFDFSSLVVANDAFDLSLDSAELTPISHMVKADLGLLIFTAQQVLQIRSTEDDLISATTVRAQSVSDLGAEPLKPIRAEDNTLYLSYGSYGVFSIQPTQLRNYYDTIDISIFSNHFFKPYNKVVSWTLAKSPQSLVWAVRQDGTLLSMAYKPEQNVYAWTDHSTKGFFRDVVTVTEGAEDVVYTVVERQQNRHFIERFAPLEPQWQYDNFALDSFVRLPRDEYTTLITASARKGTGVTLTDVDNVGAFASVLVGDHIQFGGAVVEVTANNGSTLTVNYLCKLRDVDPQTFAPKEYNLWYRVPQITEIRGLWHLHKQRLVGISGNDFYDLGEVPQNGVVTLPVSMPLYVVGIDYSGDLITLPLKLQGAVVEDKKKNITDVSLRIEGAQAFTAGTLTSGEFFDINDEGYDTFELDEYIDTTIYEMAVSSDWEEDDSIVIRKARPFRGKVLGMVVNAEFGLD